MGICHKKNFQLFTKLNIVIRLTTKIYFLPRTPTLKQIMYVIYENNFLSSNHRG